VTARQVGRPLPRVEDARLVAGAGAYLDDLQVPGLVHAALLRSPHAHARILGIDAAAAREAPGVVAVWTAADLPAFPTLPARSMPGARIPHHPVLARDTVRHVGEPVALVVAADRYRAADAAERVSVEYEPLDPLLDARAALEPAARLVHPQLGSNEAYRMERRVGDVAAAFAGAAVRVRVRTAHPRLAAVPIEPRGVMARPPAAGQPLTVWMSTQGPFGARESLAPFLGLDEHSLRVIAPDVGGAFGVKNGLYPEDVLIPWAAQQLNRPVKWVEERSESMVATHQGRGLILEGELAAAADGTLLGLRASVLGDAGAYLRANTVMPPIRAFQLLSGCYRIPAMEITVRLACTHNVPTGPYRGAGRPEGNYCIERLMDELAAALPLDPAELRRRNFIPPGAFPFATATGMQYDSGNYAPALDHALRIVDYPALRSEPPPRNGTLRGIGIACFVETNGLERPESASVAVEHDGRVTVRTGTSPHGQGHETILAQVISDELGVSVDRVSVLHGDTAAGPRGTGTFGSRSAALGGAAVLLASRTVRGRVLAAAAHLLEARAEDLTLQDNQVRVRGTERVLPLAQLASARGRGLPAGLDGDLQATQSFQSEGLSFSFGAHVAVVEIDRETGQVRVVRYVAVDDCGRVINPLIVEGQIHGGVAQGIAEALYEEMRFDSTGQPQTGTLMDYGVPTAMDLPPFETDRTETPSPLNPLGAKGVGESGTIGAPIAVANAVRDALRPLGVAPLDPPFLADRVWRALREATASN